MKNTNVSTGDLYTLVGLSQISVAESNAYKNGEGDLYHTPDELKDFVEGVASNVFTTCMIVNYSHPLTQYAKDQLFDEIGPFTEVDVPVNIDFTKPILGQVEALALQCPTEATHIIPPALSYATAVLMRLLRPLPIIVLKREGTPSQFVLSEIVSVG